MVSTVQNNMRDCGKVIHSETFFFKVYWSLYTLKQANSIIPFEMCRGHVVVAHM